MIRSCNELLRRLSKSKNTNFRGRVLMFMAYAFPLAERSGVNLKGASAISNLEIEAEPEEGMLGDGGAAPAGGVVGDGGDGEVVDFGFYSTFWGLQQAFASPAASMRADTWPALVERLELVLGVFGSFSGQGQEAEGSAAAAEGAEGAADGAEGAAEGAAEELEEVYFAKFLTSSKLINLQLRDGYFRRHVLVQMLIFLQTISTERKGGVTLSYTQRQQVESMHARCISLLRAIPPAGARFADAVVAMLEREEHWIEWKRSNCPPFDKATLERAVAEPSGAGGAAPKRRAAAAAGSAAKRVSVGSKELTKLWNMGSNDLESIAKRHAESHPALGEYLKPVLVQMDPDEGIEEEYRLKNDKTFCWKALRLISKQDVSLLSKVNAQGGSLETAVKAYFDGLEGAANGEAKEEAPVAEGE